MSVLIGEKRKEVRRPAQGAVCVRFTNPATEINGTLVDISPSGFRMAHECRTLAAGQVVEFAHVEGKGTARAVWTRIADGRVETGFFILTPG